MHLYLSAGFVYSQNSTTRSQVHLKTAFPFIDGFARIENGAKTYFIDTAGNYAFDKLVPIKEYTGAPGRFSLAVIKDKITHKNKWGIIKAGQWILQPVYDTVDTRFNIWKLKKNGKITWCDTTGKLLMPLRFSDMIYMDGIYFDVCQNGKRGIYNARTDSVVIPIQYDGFDYCGGCDLSSDYVLAMKNGKWGVIGFDNKIRVPFEYEHQHFNMRSDEWVFSLQQKNRQVLINMNTGKIFAEPEYKFPVNVIWNDLACLIKSNKSGLVNAAGQPVTKFEYDNITGLTDAGNQWAKYACVEKNSKYGLIDTTGAIIIPVSHDGFIRAYNDSTFIVNADTAKMLLDGAGNNLLPEYYTDISEVEGDGKAPWLFTVFKNGKYGLYNRRLQVLTPLEYDDIPTLGLNGFIVTKRDHKQGLLNLQGKEILLPQFDFIFRDFKDSGFLKLKIYLPDGSGQEGLATIDGKLLLPTGYNSIVELSNGHHWLLQKDTTYFLFNSHTGKKDPLPFGQVLYSGKNELLLVNDGKNAKLFDAATGRIIADGFETISPFQGHTAFALKQGKTGAINAQGQTMIPFTYHQLTNFKDGLFMAQQNNDKYGVIDSTGREIVPIEFDTPVGFYGVANYVVGNNLLLFKQSANSDYLLKGLARKDGKIIAPPQYDNIWKDENGPRYLVQQNGKLGVLAEDGTFIIPPVYYDIRVNDIDKYAGVTSMNFPLLCYDGKNWKYITLSGTTLPFTASNIAQP